MAATPYAPALTRTWWAGTDANLDIHIEAYEGEIEGSFRVSSVFRATGLTNFKSVANQTNAYRGDRIGGVFVRGRTSGQTLDPSRIINDKYLIEVKFTSYVRTPFDWQDEWTSPDFMAEYSAEHSSAHAKMFDLAHMIKLIHAGEWKAPADLAGKAGAFAFKDGITYTATGLNAATTDEAKAEVLSKWHKAVVTEFIKRDIAMSADEFITLIHPDWFSVLLEHKKLLNLDYKAPNGNEYAQRRIATMNGSTIVEMNRFPVEGDATTDNHPASVLGAEFTVTAAQAKSKMIVFLPSKTLVTVEAKGMTVRKWDSNENFNSVLDSYQMYTVGIKRGDACAVIREE
ncbi:putative capsid and scaffold protein [Achromobacter phage vB_AxyP_19-32_Axy09]|uniref:Putative capsid and scaffold protein n=2 Tax=Axyvirus TaxID=3424993 RepID=A0A514CW41_9CAUD|nr:putative capsid and scaffold protein [Achromobacter phage vB_AxyP_19-32_Axy09]QDH84681.1 putative capsid and scaffold protein [Achromobacter phage vB_AxyP_19-32_Axy23]